MFNDLSFQILVKLCSFVSPAEELAQKDDLQLLFSAITSWCPPYNLPWRKSAGEVLMTISRHGLSVNVVKYIHGMYLYPIYFFLFFFHSFLKEMDMKIIDQGKLTFCWGFLGFFWGGHVGVYIEVKFQSSCVVREVFVAQSASSIYQVNIGGQFPLMFWCRVCANQKERLSATLVATCIEK